MSKTVGALFVNDKKGNPSAPDYQGDFKLTQEFLAALTAALGDAPDCKVKLAGWKKQGQKGPYLSLSIQPPFVADGQSRPASAPAKPRNDLDDSIPF